MRGCSLGGWIGVFTVLCPQVGLTIMLITIVGLSIVVSVTVGGFILTVVSPPLMGIAALMPFIGFAFGYVISALFRLNPS